MRHASSGLARASTPNAARIAIAPATTKASRTETPSHQGHRRNQVVDAGRGVHRETAREATPAKNHGRHERPAVARPTSASTRTLTPSWSCSSIIERPGIVGVRGCPNASGTSAVTRPGPARRTDSTHRRSASRSCGSGSRTQERQNLESRDASAEGNRHRAPGSGEPAADEPSQMRTCGAKPGAIEREVRMSAEERQRGDERQCAAATSRPRGALAASRIQGSHGDTLPSGCSSQTIVTGLSR